MKPNVIPVEVLDQLLIYHSATGQFEWKRRSLNWFHGNRRLWRGWNTQFSGKPALIANLNGYKQGCILKTLVYAHRVAWAMHYGAWPEGEIDHINGDRSDNRILNLRDVPHRENQKNQKLPRHNTSRAVGVTWNKNANKWMAQIAVGGENRYLGIYSNIDDAIAARKDAEQRFGFHQNHGRTM